MAWICYPSSFAIESPLYRVSDECFIEINETSSFFSSYNGVQFDIDVFPLNLGPEENATPPKVVFIYAKSNAKTFRRFSGNMNQLIVNIKQIQGV